MRQRCESIPVAVVVVTWNGGEEVLPCLRSAVAARAAEVIVVDNASADNTRDLVQRHFRHARLIANPENRGFAEGCNQGYAASSAPFVLFLNSDAVLETDYLQRIVGALQQDPEAASAVGKLVYCDGDAVRIDSAGIELHRWRLSPEDRGYGEVDTGQYDKAGIIFGGTGAAVTFRRDAIEEVSGPRAHPFDEALFAYYEDVDLAWRLNRAGWHQLYVPSARAWHRRRGPSGKPPAIAARAFVNRYRVWLKNESLALFVSYAPVAIPWEVMRIVRRSLSRGFIRPFLRALTTHQLRHETR